MKNMIVLNLKNTITKLTYVHVYKCSADNCARQNSLMHPVFDWANVNISEKMFDFSQIGLTVTGITIVTLGLNVYLCVCIQRGK